MSDKYSMAKKSQYNSFSVNRSALNSKHGGRTAGFLKSQNQLHDDPTNVYDQPIIVNDLHNGSQNNQVYETDQSEGLPRQKVAADRKGRAQTG